MISDSISLEERIALLREDARQAAQQYGSTSREYAVAADNLEETLAELSHRSQNLSAFERFCVTHPDAQECRIYDN
jgi:hypothetical protein